MKQKTLLLVLSLSSLNVNALAIDNMLFFTDNSGSTRIELLNNESRKAFVKIAMSKIQVDNNKFVNIPLTSKNISEWNLSLTPSKTILEPKQAKSIAVHYSCNNCKRDKDEIYKLSITPIPYDDSGKLTEMKLGFGFAPYIIVPALEQKPDYNIEFTKDKKGIIFTNSGNTFLNAVIDICKKEQNRKCNISHRMLPGRSKVFKLNSNVQKLKSIKFYVVNHDESYKDIKVLQK
ncbi:hypothetical protein [Photobacterium damselae]|uniref:hypothetical protein n=1 Tax=Photobacterium damselae TaxID=38293 RepID=UPI004069246D